MTLRLTPAWQWVAEYYPIVSRSDEPGIVTITLRASELAWVVVGRAVGRRRRARDLAGVAAVRAALAPRSRHTTPS